MTTSTADQPAVRDVAASALSVEHVSKVYGGTQALDDVSFTVARGSVHALLGGNGSGKSTLIKILAGVVTPDAGSITIGGATHDARTQTPARARTLGLHFVHQQDSTFPDLTVAENLAIGRGFETGAASRVRWAEQHRRAAAICTRFGIHADPRTELRELGAATRMMVAIARALQDQDDAHDGVLVLDEPTASLPRNEVELLLDSLRRYAGAGQTIVYVTHRLEEVLRVADRATILRDGRLAATMPRGAFDHDTLVTAIMGMPIEKAIPDRDEALVGGGNDPVLELARPGSRSPFVLRRGEVVGVAGLLGSGRSRLLRQIFGVAPRAGLAVRVDGRPFAADDPPAAMRAGIAYVPEDRVGDAAFADLSIAENLSITMLRRHSRFGRISGARERAAARELIRSFSIRARSERAGLSSLSGGNQQKVVLARWLQRKPQVLLLDEPTQGVDVGARAEIHNLIRRATADGAGALLVSSDFEELVAACHRAVVVRDGAIVAEVGKDGLTEDRLNTLVYAQEHAS